ncbi:MAG TPA: recombination protein NinB [Roseateles sp.]|uniref:recombination protein NinB n=1 Tax=Roseateles sp. TaxID=1971397 RepID=UPI002EDB455F
MTQRIVAKASTQQELRAEFQRAWVWAQEQIAAGNTLAMEFEHAKSREQERLYHSCFNDLARDCLYAGHKVPAEIWKRGLLQAFYEATKSDPDFADDWRKRKPRLIPTLEGDGMFMLTIESKRFTKNLASGFITFVHSVGDQRGVRWSRTSLGRDVPDEAVA